MRGNRKSEIGNRRRGKGRVTAPRFPVSDSRFPATMTAVVKTKAAPGPAATEIKTVPVPTPGQAEVLIRVIATAVIFDGTFGAAVDRVFLPISLPPGRRG